jgi:hypothetical protein
VRVSGFSVRRRKPVVQFQCQRFDPLTHLFGDLSQLGVLFQ